MLSSLLKTQIFKFAILYPSFPLLQEIKYGYPLKSYSYSLIPSGLFADVGQNAAIYIEDVAIDEI